MNSKRFLCAILLLQIGCSNREVLLESGLYQADSTAGVLGLLSGLSSTTVDTQMHLFAYHEINRLLLPTSACQSYHPQRPLSLDTTP